MGQRRGRTHGVWLVSACLLCLWIPCGAARAAGERFTALARTLGDARLWRRFDLAADGIDEIPLAVVEDARGTPWIILSNGVAYYDGRSWTRVAGVDWNPRLPLAQAALAERGLVLLIDGRALVVDERNVREVPLPAGHEGYVGGAAALPDGSILLQLIHTGAGPGPHSSLILVDDNGTSRPFDVPAPLVPVGSHGLWRSRSGAVWLNTVRGLWVDRGDGWRLHLPVRAGEYLDIVAHDESPDGVGALAVRHPVESRGVWIWRDGERPTRQSLENRGLVRTLAVPGDGPALITLESDRVGLADRADWLDAQWVGPLAAARQLFVGQQQRLWAIEPSGLYLHWPGYGLWQPLSDTAEGLGGYVNALLPRDDGSLWLATSDGLRIVRPNGVVDAVRAVDGELLGTVTGLGEDRAGNVWVSSGSSFRGLRVRDSAGWRRVDLPEPGRAGYFHKIVRDHHGRLWLLGLRYTGYMLVDSPGVGVWVVDDSGLHRWTHGSELPGQQVYGLAEGNDESLWFATMGGLARYRDGEWTRWGEADGLRAGRIFDVTLATDGRAYFTHTTRGLGVIETDDSVHYLDERDGLPLRQIWGLLADGDRLWIAGEGGVGLYRDGHFAAAGLAGSLASQRVWPLALRDGELLAGTQGRGVVRLDRAALPSQPIGLRLRSPLTDADAVRVGWDAVYPWELLPGNEILTRHKLDGGGWSRWSTERSVTLPGLAGEHTLTVESMGLLGTIDTTAAGRVAAPLPLHRNPLFYTPIYALVVALVGFGAVSWRRRRRQERRLRSSERRYRSLFANASDLIFICDLDWRLEAMNAACLDTLGYARADVVGLTVAQVLAPEYHALAAEMLQLKLQGRTSTTYEAELLRKDGDRLPVELSSQLVVDDDRAIGIQAFARDIRERKRVEETLRNVAMGVSADTGDDFFRSLVSSLAAELDMEMALVGVLARGGDDPVSEKVQTLTFWNDGALGDNFEYVLEGTPCQQSIRDGTCIFTEGVREAFPDDAFAQKEEIESYVGTSLLDSAGEPLGIMVLMSRRALRRERLTQSVLQIFAIRAAAEIEKMRTQEALQRAEEELRQAQKMEAIGRLAGGVAHDFNNLLTVVTGHAELLLAETASDDPRREDLQHIARAGHSAARLTGQLLALSRRQAVETVPVHPNEAVVALEPLLRRLLGKDNQLALELDGDVGGIRIGAGHLEQVLMNLVVNAVDATPAGGPIVVRTRRVAAGAHGHGPEQVLLEVEDHGTGMDRETLERVFEPFFTTKEPGHGTGLGLSTVYGIVQQSGADIGITSEPDAGTRVRITWEALAAEELAALESEEDAVAHRGDERILLVEDEGMVRSFVQRSLERLGYRVVSAGSANEAIGILEGPDAEPFDLLLSDVVMPGIDGVVLARHVRSTSPHTRILFMSGYADSARVSEEDLGAYLRKPFTPADLGRRVRETLDAGT